MFDYKKYVQKFLVDASYNIINNNSILKIQRHKNADGVYAIIGIHKLTPDENVGKHNLFIEVIDRDGKRIPGIRMKWGWDGQRPDEYVGPVALDKPINEPSGNIVIWGNQTIWTEVEGFPSDRVYNAHTRLADEGPGNTYGHYSYLVVWMLMPTGEDGDPNEPEDCRELEELYKNLRQSYLELEEKYKFLISKLILIKDTIKDI